MHTGMREMENVQKRAHCLGNWYQMCQDVESPFFNVLRYIVPTSNSLKCAESPS